MAQPTIAPEAAPTQTPDIPQLASAGAMGGEVAAAGADLAQGVTQRLATRREIDLRNQYEDQLTQGQLGVANSHIAMAAQINAIQQDPTLDLKDYAARVGAAYDQVATGITDGITSGKAQRIIGAQVAEGKDQYVTQAENWQFLQQNTQIVKGAAAVDDANIGLARAAGASGADPAALDTIYSQGATFWHALDGATPDQRSAGAMGYISNAALAYGQSLAGAYPDKARKLFDAGYFASHGVGERQQNTLDNTIRIAKDRKDNLIEAQIQTAQHATVVNAEEKMRTVDAGGSVPLPDIVNTIHAVSAIPNQGALVDRLKGAAITMGVNAQYQSKPPEVITAAAAALQSQVYAAKAAGKPVSIEAGQTLAALQGLAQRQSSAATNAPWTLAPSLGLAPPMPFDWNDPHAAQALVQRLGQRDVLAARLGPGYSNVPPLQAPEANQLKNILTNGSADDQLRAVSIIAGLDKQKPGASAQIFGQANVAPEMRMAGAMMTGVNPHGAQDAADLIAGYQALKKLPELLPKSGGGGPDFNSKVLQALGGALGSNIAALSGDPRYIGVVAAAKGLYAQTMAQQGAQAFPHVDQTVLNQSVNRALGGYTDAQGVKRGGLGAHNGTMVLPDGVSQPEFDQKVVSALPQALAGAGVQMPHQKFAAQPAPTLRQVEDATPKNRGESEWAYQQRIGSTQWQMMVNADDDPHRLRAVLPPNVKFRAMGDGQYKLWTGSGYIADPHGRQAVWDYRTGKVSF